MALHNSRCKTVFKSAVSEMANATEQIIKRNNLNPEEIKYLLPHQQIKELLMLPQKRLI